MVFKKIAVTVSAAAIVMLAVAVGPGVPTIPQPFARPRLIVTLN